MSHKATQRFLASKIREAGPDSPRDGELMVQSAADKAAQVAARLERLGAQRSHGRGQESAPPFVLTCSSAVEAAAKWPWDEQDDEDLSAMERKDQILLARQQRDGERLHSSAKARDAESGDQHQDIMSGGYQGWRPATVAATLPAEERAMLAMSLRRWCSYIKTVRG